MPYTVKKASKGVKASVLLISGCQDNQFSLDGAFNGRVVVVRELLLHVRIVHDDATSQLRKRRSPTTFMRN